jgi:hypothetical protein
MKQHVVIYFHNPGPQDEYDIKRAFGRAAARNLDMVFPFVSEPMELAEIEAALPKLVDTGVVLVQPPLSEIAGMTRDEALELVRRDSEWDDLLRRFRVDVPHSLETKEFPHCWLILVQAREAGIPPGGGFIVDKHSKRVLVKRWVDVAGRIHLRRMQNAQWILVFTPNEVDLSALADKLPPDVQSRITDDTGETSLDIVRSGERVEVFREEAQSPTRTALGITYYRGTNLVHDVLLVLHEMMGHMFMDTGTGVIERLDFPGSGLPWWLAKSPSPDS